MVAQRARLPHVIVIPQTQSQEKKDTLRLCGAELVEVPALPYKNPNNYQHIGRRLAEELRKTEPNGVHLRRPVEQPRQPQGALRLDRPGDLGRPGGKVDGFICAVGSGGTLGGVSGSEGKEASRS